MNHQNQTPNKWHMRPCSLQVQNDDDLRLLERLCLGNGNDDDDTIPPLEHDVESMDMRDSDDEYDLDIPDYDDYFSNM
jgi:hypothetical protein